MAGILLPKRSRLQKPPLGSIINPNAPILQGCQALYLFNEGGGPSFAEATRQHPAASFIANTGTPWTNGLFGNALAISSTIGYVNAGNICDNMANFSVSMWFKSTASPGSASVVSKMGSGGQASGQGWSVHHFGGKFGVFTQLSGGSTFRELDTTATFNDGKWHHGVFTVLNYIPQTIYIDGIKVAAGTLGSGSVTTTTTATALELGADNGAADSWLGTLDVVGIWNRVLTADEANRLYSEPFHFMANNGNVFSKARIVKKPASTLSITPSGVPSLEGFGSPTISHALLPAGIGTSENEGAVTFSFSVLPKGISPDENEGAALTTCLTNLFPQGLFTAENLGAAGLAESVILSGISSSEVSGAVNAVTNNAENVFMAGITSQETQGAPAVLSGGVSPGGVYNLLMAGITSAEFLGAMRTIRGATNTPFAVPMRKRNRLTKPSVSAHLNSASTLSQGLVAGWLFNEGGGFAATDIISGASNSFAGSPSVPTWVNGHSGPAVHFPGGTSAGRVVITERPAIIDLGLTGAMSVAFWYNFDAAQLALANGATMMGKSDSTDGVSGFTHGWNVNSDNWHLNSFNNPVSSGPQNIKLEFERSIFNKQGGIPAPTTPGVWHHIVMTTTGGAATPNVNDYSIYLDGVLQQNIFFIAGTGDPTTSDSSYNLTIGSHSNGSAPFAGSLDTVLLYNRELTSAEAQQLYLDPYCWVRTKKSWIAGMAHSTGPSLNVLPLGIVSAEQLGAIAAFVPPTLSVTPLGIQSSEVAGLANVSYPQGVTPLGIVSEDRMGAFVASLANIQTLFPGAIASYESLGGPTAIVGVAISSGRIFNPKQQYRIFSITIDND